MIFALAWAGFAFTVLGSFLLVGDRREGWVAYIVANVLWGIVALSTGQIPLLAQMCVLTIPALLGVRKAKR
jgi:hypothetical protein